MFYKNVIIVSVLLADSIINYLMLNPKVGEKMNERKTYSEFSVQVRSWIQINVNNLPKNIFVLREPQKVLIVASS